MKIYKFEIYKDKNKEWRFRLIAPNGRIIADSGEGYKRKFYCRRNVTKIINALSQSKYVIEEI